MKKIALIFCIFLLFSCGSEVVRNNCFVGISVSESLNLTNPEFINLQVDAGNVITTLPQSRRTIVIIKRSPTNIKAFDLQCPSKDCATPMTFDGLKLKCTCDSQEYSSLYGCPVNKNGACIEDGSCFALEYNVQQSGNRLIISR